MKVYLTQNIDYSLDEENQQGLKLFYKLAHEVGIIPAEKGVVVRVKWRPLAVRGRSSVARDPTSDRKRIYV